MMPPTSSVHRPIRRLARSAAVVAALVGIVAMLAPSTAGASDHGSLEAELVGAGRWLPQGTDAARPLLEVDVVANGFAEGRPVLVTGRSEPGIRVRVSTDGTATREVRAGPEGAFTVQIAAATTTVHVEARSAMGRTSNTSFEMTTVPSRVTLDAYRAAHVSFCGWASSMLREGILGMLEEGRINAVQLDLKDEAGHVGYASEVTLAERSGATDADCVIDLENAVAELHEAGVPVIGRIVAFADPVLASWAWDNDRRDMVVQSADGEMYVGRYQGFTNFAHPDVVAYNVDIAEEAARLGVDHILWDYVRRPDGTIADMHFEGLETTPEDGIVRFLEVADERLARYGIEHGASVYGIAATRPTQIGQDIPRMADHVDYVAPMLYPTHWGPGELGIADPVREPYQVVHSSLETFTDAVEGRRARVVPWLEDSDYRTWDRPFEVSEQLRATYERGIEEWLLWDPWVRYTPEAIEPR